MTTPLCVCRGLGVDRSVRKASQQADKWWMRMRICQGYKILREMLKTGGFLVTSPQVGDDTDEIHARTLLQIDGDIVTSIAKTNVHDDEVIKEHFDRVSRVVTQLDNFRRDALMGLNVVVSIALVPFLLARVWNKGIDGMTLIGGVMLLIGAIGITFTIFTPLLRWIIARSGPKCATWSESRLFPDEPMRLF